MKIKRLNSDFETCSGNDISRGAHVYAEDSECLLMTYSPDDDPTVYCWSPATGETMPDQLLNWLRDPSIELVFHNAEFDRSNMLAWGWDTRYGIDLNPRRFLCTATLARMNRLPGGLEDLCAALGLPEQYSKKDGKALIRKFCIPNADGSFTQPGDAPEEWQRFVTYAKYDIIAMRECYKRMPMVFSDKERELYAYTTLMNDRGIQVDRELAVAAMTQADDLKKRYKKKGSQLAMQTAIDAGASAEDIAAASGLSVTSQKAMLDFLSSYGVKLEDARASTIEKFLESSQASILPETVRELMSTRLMSNKASVAKYSAVIKGCSSDGRLRGTLSFYGAGTGRDAGRRFQPQNLSRPMLLNKNFTMDDACKLVKQGLGEFYFSDPMQLLSDTVRGVLIPKPGHKFCDSDLASIEGRVLPWLAEETWMVDYFRDLDAGIVKYDGYELAYSTAFGVDPNTVTKAQRTLGKPIDLACLAGDTLVVTDNGIKPIIEVSLEDRLWDGTCWVKHQGVVQKGVRKTVSVDGIHLTADHLVETQGTWKPAGQLVSDSNALIQASETGLAALQSLNSFGALPGGFTTCLHNAIAERLNTKFISTTCLKEPPHNATRAQRKLAPQPTEKTIVSTSASFPTTSIADGYLTESHLQSSGAITQRIKNFIPMAVEELVSTNLGEKTEGNSLRILSLSKGGMTPCLRSTEQTLTATTSQETYGLYPVMLTSQTNEKLETCSSESLNSKPVYDILNAGSRNKFTVLTASGALVVHNCGYGGGTGALITFATIYRIDIDDMAQKARAAADPYMWQECADSYAWYAEKGLTNGLKQETWVGCQYIIQSWRAKRADTSALWRRCEEAFRNAADNPGVSFKMANNTFAYSQQGWVFVQLPSGRTLVYPQVHEVDRGGRPQLAYTGVNPFTRKWGSVFTYGGRLTENITQAVARDVMLWSVPQVEAAGYPIVARVHDQLLTEPIDTPEFTGDKLAAIMSTPHAWCMDLPLAAEGADLYRFQK